MNKRLLGLVLAVGLAALGTFLLVNYVRSAEDRALAGEETVPVYVLDDAVASGESADVLADRVRVEEIPVKVRTEGSVAALTDLTGQVAAVDLLPGEQLIAGRFITPEELEDLESVEVPEGMLEVSISLSPERAVGGQLIPGELVAFIASFAPFTIEEGPDENAELAGFGSFSFTSDASDPSSTDTPTAKTPNTTHIALHKVLVTSIQVERLPRETDSETAAETGIELAPTGNLLITLAADAPDIERMIFASEFGTIWLAHEPENAPEDGTLIQTRLTVYR